MIYSKQQVFSYILSITVTYFLDSNGGGVTGGQGLEVAYSSCYSPCLRFEVTSTRYLSFIKMPIVCLSVEPEHIWKHCWTLQSFLTNIITDGVSNHESDCDLFVAGFYLSGTPLKWPCSCSSPCLWFEVTSTRYLSFIKMPIVCLSIKPEHIWKHCWTFQSFLTNIISDGVSNHESDCDLFVAGFYLSGTPLKWPCSCSSPCLWFEVTSTRYLSFIKMPIVCLSVKPEHIWKHCWTFQSFLTNIISDGVSNHESNCDLFVAAFICQAHPWSSLPFLFFSLSPVWSRLNKKFVFYKNVNSLFKHRVRTHLKAPLDIPKLSYEHY